MAPPKAKRTIVGVPMTPDLMVRIGGWNKTPPEPGGFRPDGSWINEYRIHTCHGYVESSNDDVGVLRIERIPEGVDGGFTLKIRQRIVNDAGSTNIIDAWIRCRLDGLATPTEWRVMSGFEDLSGDAMPELAGEENGRSENGTVTIRRGDSEQKFDSKHAVTSDWSLCEAVQRLEFRTPEEAAFDFLESLSLRRAGHRLRYRGIYRMKEQPKAAFHWFQQLGHGVLPYEYWLDDDHRLRAVGTQARAYILDDSADDRLYERLKEIRERSARRRNG